MKYGLITLYFPSLTKPYDLHNGWLGIVIKSTLMKKDLIESIRLT